MIPNQAVCQPAGIKTCAHASIAAHRIANVRGVCCEEYPSDFETGDAAVVDIVEVRLLDAVFVRLRMAREHGFEVGMPPGEVFFIRESRHWVTIRHSPQAAVSTSRDEAPVLRIDHVVAALPAVLLEAIVEDILDDEAQGEGLAGPVFAEKGVTYS